MARAFHCLGKESGDGKSMGPVVLLHHRFLAWNMELQQLLARLQSIIPWPVL